MRNVRSRRMVVDASVARGSGGEDTEFPDSKYCRDLLLAIRRVGHRLVMTPEIAAEWDRHQSRFALTWRTSMAKMGNVVVLDAVAVCALREELPGLSLGTGVRAAILKDLHLL
jgi:hypothetical protein